MVGHPGRAMKIRILEGLAYVTATLNHQGRELVIENVILDTGSVSTVFSADKVSEIGLLMESHDPIHRMWGVGGTEFVFGKHVTGLALGNLEVSDFAIQVGAMDYGLAIEGIIGLDFLVQAQAIIDLDRLEVYRSE